MQIVADSGEDETAKGHVLFPAPSVVTTEEANGESKDDVGVGSKLISNTTTRPKTTICL